MNIPLFLLAIASQALDGAFNNSAARLVTVTTVKGDSGRDIETVSPPGPPFGCDLQPMEGDEVPQALSLLNRGIYAAFVPLDFAGFPKDRLLIDGVSYEIHDVPRERTNALSIRLTVSRLK